MRIHRSKKLNIAGLPLQFPEGDRPTEPDTRERGLPFASDRNRNYNDEVATERQPQKSSHWNRPKKHAVFLYSFIHSFLPLPALPPKCICLDRHDCPGGFRTLGATEPRTTRRRIQNSHSTESNEEEAFSSSSSSVRNRH